MESPNQESMTVAEAASRLRTSRMTVRRYIKQGLLDAVKLGPASSSHFRISTSSVEKMLDTKGGL